MDLQELVVVLKANTTNLQKGLQNTTKSLDNVSKRAGELGSSLTKNITLPIIAAAGAIGGAMVKFGDFADEILDLSSITGLSTDELQRWRKIAIEAGVDINAVANSLTTFNKQLERGNTLSPRLQRGFETMGISADEFREMLPDDQMRQMVQTMVDLDDQDARAFANQMNMPELLPIMDDVIDSGGDIDAVMEGVEVPFTQEELERMDSFRRSWDNLKDSVFLMVGDALQPAFEWFEKNQELIDTKLNEAIEALSDSIKSLADWWGSLSPEVKKFIGLAVGLLAALGPVLIVVSKLLIGIKVLGVIIGVIASPVGIIIGLVVALAAGLIYLWNTNEEFRDKVIEAWEKIKEVGLIVWEGLKEGALAFWEVLKDSWDSIVDLWEKDLKPAFEELWEEITKIFEEVQEAISEAFGDGEEDAMSFAEIMKAAGKIIGEVVVAIIKGFMWIVARIADVIAWYFKLHRRVREIGEKIGQSIKDWVQDGVDGFNNMIDWFQKLPGRMEEFGEEVIDWFQKLPGRMKDFGEDMIQGLIDGIKNMAGNLTGELSDIVGDAVDGAKSLLGISSPSKVFEEMGRDVGLGFEKGIDKMGASVEVEMQGMVDPSGIETSKGPVSITNNFAQTEMDVDALSRKLNFQMQTI